MTSPRTTVHKPEPALSLVGATAVLVDGETVTTGSIHLAGGRVVAAAAPRRTSST